MTKLSSTIIVATLLLSIAKSTAFVPSTPYQSTTSLQQSSPTLQRRGSSLGNNILNHKEKRHVSEVISSRTKQHTPLLHMVSVSAPSSPDISVRDEINAMRLADIKKELDSYGVDSNAFFEKKELVEALVKARQEEWIHSEFETTSPPDFDASTATSSTRNDHGSSFDKSVWEASAPSSSTYEDTSSSSKKKKDSKSWFQSFKDNVTDKFDKGVDNMGRKAKIDLEMTKLKDIKTRDLKKELESYGIDTRSCFEKSAFVKAAAEARVDGVKKTSRTSSKYSRSSSTQPEEEKWDPSYKNVYCRKFDASMIDPSGVIDIRAR
eukprot:787325_1